MRFIFSSRPVVTATAATRTTNPATSSQLRRLLEVTWSYTNDDQDLELDLRRAAGLVVGLEVLALGEAEGVGQHVGGEALDLGVIAVHGVVVELAGGGDAPPRAGLLLPELGANLVGLQVGVRLGQREQRLER